MENEQIPANLPSAPFPGPPPFWKHFTTTNRDRLQEIQASSSYSPDTTPPPLPHPLAYLTPPTPPHPSNETYPAFSVQIPLSSDPQPLDPDIALPELTHHSLKTLTPRLPALLLKLTRSITLTFLDLTTLLSATLDPEPEGEPQPHETTIAALERLCMNALYCVNLYRPHQAREEVIGMLEDEVESAEEECRRLDEVKGRIERFLTEVEAGKEEKALNDTNGVRKVTGSTENNEEIQQARSLWKAIREMEDD